MGFEGWSWVPVALAAGWMVTVLGAGGAITDVGPWYRGLRKPPWNPPDWAFAPAWTTIFLCAAAGFVLAWGRAGPEGRAALGAAYAVNGALNVGWSWLFFARRRPDRALWEILPLWLSIVAMGAVVGAAAGAAAWTLAPYLAWVSFAAVLNRAIVALNGPFAST